MFGWLASFGVHSRARSMASTRWLDIAPRMLFDRLAQLGGVLYLAPAPAGLHAAARTHGCLVTSVDLAPLLATRRIGLTCAVTAEGPREWIDCVGGEGDMLARIYLLPDTDYLAWDALFTDAPPADPPPRHTPDRDWLRASRARVLSFTRHRLGGLTVLGTCATPISSLGHGVARDIAVAESVGIAG